MILRQTLILNDRFNELNIIINNLSNKEPSEQEDGIVGLFESTLKVEERQGYDAALQAECTASQIDPCSVSFVGSNNRNSRVSWEDDDLHVYCLSFETKKASINIQIAHLQMLLPNDNPEVFMSLGVGTTRSAPTIRILLNGRSRNAQQFLALCL